MPLGRGDGYHQCRCQSMCASTGFLSASLSVVVWWRMDINAHTHQSGHSAYDSVTSPAKRSVRFLPMMSTTSPVPEPSLVGGACRMHTSQSVPETTFAKIGDHGLACPCRFLQLSWHTSMIAHSNSPARIFTSRKSPSGPSVGSARELASSWRWSIAMKSNRPRSTLNDRALRRRSCSMSWMSDQNRQQRCGGQPPRNSIPARLSLSSRFANNLS